MEPRGESYGRPAAAPVPPGQASPPPVAQYPPAAAPPPYPYPPAAAPPPGYPPGYPPPAYPGAPVYPAAYPGAYPYPGPVYVVAAPPQQQRSSMPTAAGVLNIINAVFTFIAGAIIVVLGGASYGVYGSFGSILLVCGLAAIVMGVFTLLAGVFCLTRKSWGLCLTGSIIGIFCGLSWTIGFVLGIVATILVAVSRHEFSQ